jgi:hypothetical protein
MTAIAFHGMLPRDVVSLRVAGRDQQVANRGWQDKSRKVRPVGRVRNSIKSNLASNIANVSCNLRFMATRRHHSAFDTLR